MPDVDVFITELEHELDEKKLTLLHSEFLAALEAKLVESSRARLLALVPASGGLAPARADAATDAMAVLLGAGGRLQ